MQRIIIGCVLIALAPVALVVHGVNIALVLTSSLLEDALTAYEKIGRLA